MPAVELWVQGCAHIPHVKQADNAQAGMPPDAGLSADESIVQLHVDRAELLCATGTNFATFVELDFFQHVTQATPIMQGPRFVLMRPVTAATRDLHACILTTVTAQMILSLSGFVVLPSPSSQQANATSICKVCLCCCPARMVTNFR